MKPIKLIRFVMKVTLVFYRQKIKNPNVKKELVRNYNTAALKFLGFSCRIPVE
jgi:hypothetical protein